METRYETMKCIGRGTSGLVYLIQHKIDKSFYALKEIPIARCTKSEKERILREIKNLSLLNCEYITKLIESEEKSDKIRLVLEYCEEGSLEEFLAYKKNIPLNLIKKWSKELLLGLKFMHDLQIVHRDIKPANILIKNNSLKLSDLGLSKMLNNSNDNNMTICGTPLFMCPESFTHDSYGLKADVWAAGLVIYQLLKQNLPFSANNYSELKKEHNKNFMFEGFPEDQKDFFFKTLQRNPEKRC